MRGHCHLSSASIASCTLKKNSVRRQHMAWTTKNPSTDLLDTQALALLWNLLVAGTDTVANARPIDSFLPPPQILALAATLVVHPSLTTRLPAAQKSQAANEALQYIHHVNKLVGCSNAGFADAFRFMEPASLSRGARRRDRNAADETQTEIGEERNVKIKLTGVDALWNRAEDFWSVLGWAFNCSIRHPARWTRWKLWLAFMLDVLENDLAERIEKRVGGADPEAALAGCLLTQYLSTIGDGRTGKRRVMRAILADGSKTSCREFAQVWKNETSERKETEPTDLRTLKLDFDKDEFGDYMDVDDDDDDAEESHTLQPEFQTRASLKKSQPLQHVSSDSDDGSAEPESAAPSSIDDFGGMESIQLRQRALALLTTYSDSFPTAFLDTEDLFDLYTEFLHPLPLPAFSHFTQPSPPYLAPASQAFLNQTLLRPLIASSAPTYNGHNMTQADLVKHYLPFAANHGGPVDNAKVSLLVESLFRLLWLHGSLQSDAALRRAVKEGVGLRAARAGVDARKKTAARARLDDEAKRVLDASGARLVALLRAV